MMMLDNQLRVYEVARTTSRQAKICLHKFQLHNLFRIAATNWKRADKFTANADAQLSTY